MWETDKTKMENNLIKQYSKAKSCEQIREVVEKMVEEINGGWYEVYTHYDIEQKVKELAHDGEVNKIRELLENFDDGYDYHLIDDVYENNLEPLDAEDIFELYKDRMGE